MNLVIIGIGALGTTLAVKLSKKTSNLFLVVRNLNSLDKYKKQELLLKEKKSIKKCTIGQFLLLDELLETSESIDYIIISTKLLETKEILSKIQNSHLKSVSILILCNGLYKWINDEFNLDIIRGIVTYNVKTLSCGKSEILQSGEVIIGELDHSIKERTLQLCEHLCDNDINTIISDNINGIEFSKLILNICVNSLSVISGVSVGEWLKKRKGKNCFMKVFQEGYLLARERKVQLEQLGNLSIGDFMYQENLFFRVVKQTILHVVALKRKQVIPSSLQSYQNQKEFPELLYIGKMITNEIKASKVNCPIIHQLFVLLSNISDGKVVPKVENLRKITP